LRFEIRDFGRRDQRTEIKNPLRSWWRKVSGDITLQYKEGSRKAEKPLKATTTNGIRGGKSKKCPNVSKVGTT